jgi:hypothetical protein
LYCVPFIADQPPTQPRKSTGSCIAFSLLQTNSLLGHGRVPIQKIASWPRKRTSTCMYNTAMFLPTLLSSPFPSLHSDSYYVPQFTIHHEDNCLIDGFSFLVALETTAEASPCKPYEIALCCGPDTVIAIGSEDILASCMSLSPGLIPSIFTSSLVVPLHIISLTSLNQAACQQPPPVFSAIGGLPESLQCCQFST